MVEVSELGSHLVAASLAGAEILAWLDGPLFVSCDMSFVT